MLTMRSALIAFATFIALADALPQAMTSAPVKCGSGKTVQTLTVLSHAMNAAKIDWCVINKTGEVGGDKCHECFDNFPAQPVSMNLEIGDDVDYFVFAFKGAAGGQQEMYPDLASGDWPKEYNLQDPAKNGAEMMRPSVSAQQQQACTTDGTINVPGIQYSTIKTYLNGSQTCEETCIPVKGVGMCSKNFYVFTNLLTPLNCADRSFTEEIDTAYKPTICNAEIWRQFYRIYAMNQTLRQPLAPPPQVNVACPIKPGALCMFDTQCNGTPSCADWSCNVPGSEGRHFCGPPKDVIEVDGRPYGAIGDGPHTCTSAQPIAVYKVNDAEWCETFCIPAALVKEVEQFGDVNNGTCASSGYTTFDHSMTYDLYGATVTVDLFKNKKVEEVLAAAPAPAPLVIHLEDPKEPHCSDLTVDFSMEGDLDQVKEWWSAKKYMYIAWAQGPCDAKYNSVDHVEHPIGVGGVTTREKGIKQSMEGAVQVMFHVSCKNKATCLQLNIPGGQDDPFWKANSYKYNVAQHPECAPWGATCGDAYPQEDSVVHNVQGFKGVDLVKYGKPF